MKLEDERDSYKAMYQELAHAITPLLFTHEMLVRVSKRRRDNEAKIILANTSAEAEKACDWHEDEDANYSTTCGQMFCLTEGGPAENKMTFCCFCGKRLTSQKGTR